MLELWAQILRAVANSRLLLLTSIDSARHRTLEQFERLGVERHRLVFVDHTPRQQYLEQYHRIDLALDTFPYNGHTTTLDSLWMGVPVVSLSGATAVGRAGLSLLSNIGLPELVAYDTAQYVEIAIALTADLQRLASLRDSLRRRMQNSPLMNAPLFARNMEGLYREVWQRWCSQRGGGGLVGQSRLDRHD